MKSYKEKYLAFTLLFCFLCVPFFLERGYPKDNGDGWASIEDVWLEHNCYKNGQKGMVIHTHFNVHILKGVKIGVVAFFFDYNEQPLRGYSSRYRSNDGKACCGEVVTMPYDDTEYKDFKLFMPYSEIYHYTTGPTTDFKVGVAIGIPNGEGLANSGYYDFTFSR